MKQPQKNYEQKMMSAGSGGGVTVIVQDEVAPKANVSPTTNQKPPTLPDGPSTAQAADYFYQLNLGGDL